MKTIMPEYVQFQDTKMEDRPSVNSKFSMKNKNGSFAKNKQNKVKKVKKNIRCSYRMVSSINVESAIRKQEKQFTSTASKPIEVQNFQREIKKVNFVIQNIDGNINQNNNSSHNVLFYEKFQIPQFNNESSSQTHVIPPLSQKIHETSNQSQQINFKQKIQQHSIKKNNKISINKEKKRLLEEDHKYQELKHEYQRIKNKNVFKNFKQAFLKHVNSVLTKEEISFYESRMNGRKYPIIKKQINFLVKKAATINKCIKLMCKSTQIAPIFSYFLENIDFIWLNQSKSNDKNEQKSTAKFLTNIIHNQECINLIEHYHQNNYI